MILDSGILPHANEHPRIISSRKWSYNSWSGCPHQNTYFDEIIAMGQIGHIAEVTSPNKLIFFSPEAPFFDPIATEIMISKLGSKYEEISLDILCKESPIGVSPFCISNKELEKLSVKSVWLPRQQIGYLNAKAQIKLRSALGFPLVENDRRNFLCRSRRDVKRLRAWDGNFDSMSQYVDDEPREIQLEVCSHPHHEGVKIPSLPYFGEMPLERFEHFLNDANSIDDILLTIGDLGNLWLHSQRDDILELLSQKKPYGVHLIFDAKDILLDLDFIQKITSYQFDIITIRLTSLSFDRDELISYEPQIKKISQYLNTWSESTVINYELHKYPENWRSIEVLQKWWEQYSIAFSWSGHNDFSGQYKEEVKIPIYYPRREVPCQKTLHQMHILPNGDVSMCRQDYTGKVINGNIFKSTILEIWNQKKQRFLRKNTIENPSEHKHKLCKDCKTCYFV
jgi:radical SAM protein with 4Fe4S-binding SPASM domain